MADATWAIPHFLGGEVSDFAQGRFDRPDYRVSLNVCINAFPVEIGPWTRRPGTWHAGFTRSGEPGRVLKFDFEQSNAVTMEFTDGWLRFRSGPTMLFTTDPQVVVGVSSANPAVVQTTLPVTWATGDTLMFGNPGPAPLLENRQFIATKIDTTHFSLADALTRVAIDGATLGTLIAGSPVARVQELVTPYAGGSWADIRVVQAQTTAILLNPNVAPQAVTVVTTPSHTANATFAINPAIFNDGPYLDPFINGVQATPSAKTGIISLTLAFPAYSASKAYAVGSFVTYSGVTYISLKDQNVGNTPNVSATYWAASSINAAINDGLGFLGSDVGRLVRLYSEPPAWDVASTYAASTAATPIIVSYNPSGNAGETTYWSSLVGSNTGHAPGSDLLNWQIVSQGAAVWTWGRITGLSTTIASALAGSVNFGDMTQGGGVAAAFDGVFTQAAVASAERIASGNAPAPSLTLTSYIGKDYSGSTDQKIQQVTIYPSSDSGLGFGSYVFRTVTIALAPTIIFNLRGSATLPADSSNGTLLGTSGSISNTLSAVTIGSSDQTTAWKYVWVEQITIASPGLIGVSYSLANAIAEISFFNPPGTGTGTGVSVEVLGPPLLYTSPVLIWRLGAYSDTTGWPTCGCYDEGRLWLGGAVANRFDASVSNGVLGGTINFAPTNQFGAVAASNSISYTLNARDANKIVFMSPEESGIIMGTRSGEWLVRAPQNGAVAPNNISARRVTKIGAADIEPYRTEHTNIFVQRYGRKLMEFFPDAYSGKFTGPNLADKAEHIVSQGISEIAYTSAVTPIIWGRCSDGSLFGITYKRDTLTTSQPPTFAAWHQHVLGSGRTVESICSGPSVGGDLDTLTMVTTDSGGLRHVELLTDTPDENVALIHSWYLDNASVPTSLTQVSPGATYAYGGVNINGLWHLNGKTVQVFAGGLDCGDPGEGGAIVDFVVSNGSIFVPYADGISAGPGRGLFTAGFLASIPVSKVVVGFTYNSDGQTVRPIAPADTGARNGPALDKTRRTHRYGVLVSNTLGISFGSTLDNLKPALFRKPNGDPIAALTTFSGVHSDVLTGDYSYDGMVAWRISRPWPANVVALTGNLQTQDR